MIIEFVDLVESAEPGDAQKIIFMHIDTGKDPHSYVKQTGDRLKKFFPNYAIMSVPNGQPCPTNPQPKIAIFDGDNKTLLSAIRKMCERGKPGAFVPMEKEELKAIVAAQSKGDLIYF